MSATPISISQDMWDGNEEGVITTWLYNDGASVTAGDVIAEVMVEKVEMEVTAPVSGTLKISSQAEDIIAKGSTIGTIV